MLKKLISIAALTSLLVGGLNATQANAEAPNVDPSNVLDSGARFQVSLAEGATQVEIPAGLSDFELKQDWSFSEEFLSQRGGQSLTVSFSITMPNGTAIGDSQQGYNPTAPSFYSDTYGSLYSNSGSVSWDWSTKSLKVPADPTGYSGNINSRQYINAAQGQDLPAGIYLFSFSLKADNTNISNVEAGLSLPSPTVRYFSPGDSFTVPFGNQNTTIEGQVCVDPNTVSVGDVLEAQVVFDGVVVPSMNSYWITRTGFKDPTEPGNRQYSVTSTTATVTAYDMDWGLASRASLYDENLVEGSTHTIGFKLFNQNGADVSGSCAPAKPAAPVLSVSSGNLAATGQFGFGSSGDMFAECSAYDPAAPSVAVQTVKISLNWMNRGSYTCAFSSIPTGKTYQVKFRDSYFGVYSDYSDASSIFLPSPGYTVTSSYAGVVEAKKIVKVSDDVLPVEDFTSFPSVVPDGTGGFYLLGQKQGSCPPICALSEVRLRKATATSLDSGFAGTGSVALSSFTPIGAFAGGMGFYGANKNKWAIPVNGINGMDMSPSALSEIFFGNTTTATVTSKLISAADVAPICEAAASGYGILQGRSMQISVVSAPTSDLLLSVSCIKRESIGGMQAELSVPVLLTMNAETGDVALAATLGTVSAEVNNISARFTVNTAATGNEPMVTAFVTSSLVTQVNNGAPNSGTIADLSVVRLDSSLNVLSTTPSAWATSGGTTADNPSLVLLTINTGKIFAITRLGLNFKVVTFGDTGVGTELTVDTTASEIATPNLSFLSGYPTPADETVLPVSVSGLGKDAAGWIDLTTGVLTTGEVLTSTSSSGNGVTKFWMRGNDKNSYMVYTDTSAAGYMTVLKWIDARYVASVGDVPVVTSKDVKYSKNTPTTGAKVTLTGTELDEVISAKIGENAATLGTKTATSLQLTIPTATAAGTVDITLTTATGDTVVDTFTYVGAGVAQTVTVAALAASVTVGNADLVLSATVEFSPVDAGTAGAITWSSETPTVCSIVANKARLLTAGTCTVKATAAASGVLLAGTGTQSTTVSAAPAAAQTVTLTGPTKVVVDLDGFDVVSSATSGLKVAFSTTTPTICTVSSAGRVVAIAVGTCVITSTQSGNASWLSASKTLTITVAKTPTTPLTEKGDIKKPLALSKTGSFLKNGDTQLGWNRSKGTLAVKLSVVYVGPVKASISFKVGSKTYTCSTKFGLLKKQSSSKLLTITSPNLCSGKTEKTQLAALKKITTSTVVTVTIVRDMYFPTTYKKIRTKTRILYAKLG